MIKKLQILTVLLILLLGYSNESIAQTCSVNAGVDRTICAKGTVMTLSGNSTGRYNNCCKVEAY